MGIYIKGVELPASCSGCFVNCIIRQYNWDSDRRPNNCPLVSVPPHGDLIERKTAYDSLLNGMAMTGYQSRALDCIGDFYVPTIIPASEEGET